VEASNDVQAVEAPVTPVIVPEPVEELTEAVELVVVEGVEENIWELIPETVEDVQEVEETTIEDDEEEVLTVTEVEKLLRSWKEKSPKRSYYISRGARALGVDGVYIDYGIVGDRVVLTEGDERLHWVSVVADPEPVVDDGYRVVSIEGRAYNVPPMPEQAPSLVYTPITDLVQGIFAEAERVHVVPYAADASVTEKRLKISREQSSYLMSLLEFSDEWVLTGVNYEPDRGLKTCWAEFLRDEFDGSPDRITVEPLAGYVTLYGPEAAVFANVPTDYLMDASCFDALVRWAS
jgi:hypothetical protein